MNNTGAILRDARGERTQEELARELHISPQSLSYWETGRRRVPQHVRQSLGDALDHPAAYQALAAEATGGVMVPRLTEAMDRHRLVAIELSELQISEYQESLHAARRTILTHPGPQLDEVSRRRVQATIHEVLDVMDSAAQTAAVLMETYQFSPRAIYAERRGRRW